MNTDCAFMIGTTHSVCQDYAFAKDRYVIVSDGCSTSPHTDVGARLLVQAATQKLSNHCDEDVEMLHTQAARQALEWAKEIGLSPQSVDATLMTAVCRDSELIIGATGDGVIIIESLSGAFDVYSISFPNGAPLYPTYEHQPDRLMAWHRNHDAYKEVRHFHASGVNNSLELVEIQTSTNKTETIRVKTDDYKQAAIISDGVHSFYKTEDSATSKHVTPIPMDHVLGQLVAFKGGHGTFVARRAKKFSRQCDLSGWHHADDLAIGAIYLGD